MKILTFSTLYPNSVQKHHGIFVENRLRRLVENGKVQSKVVAPVPWFPFKSPVFGSYAEYTQINRHEIRHGIEIVHPRYINIPKIGMTIAPWLMAVALKPVIRKIIDDGYDFDLIDAHYFYPDGVAAAILAKRFNKPLTITARGTDLNLIPQYALPKRMILWAAEQASTMITVCQALKDVLVDMGVEGSRVTVLRNGVDLSQFHPPINREKLRVDLGITRKTILSVGHLIERKGHNLVIDALTKLDNIDLLIAGDGPEEKSLRDQVSSQNLQDRVTFLGAISHDNLRDYYGAVDALVLASSREGWANVLLESMACGTPVAATSIWGTPEVVTLPESGVLIEHRTPESIAEGVINLLSNYPDRLLTRKYAEQFSWDDTTTGQETIFNNILSGARL